MSPTCRDGLRRAAAARPQAPALRAAGQEARYADLADLAARLAGLAPDGAPLRLAVIGPREVPFYGAVFAAAVNGWSYVPVNPKWPADRIARVLARAEPDAILMTGRFAPEAALSAVLQAAGVPLLPLAWGPGGWDLAAPGPIAPRPGSWRIADLLYVMFTSGSTGEPKGVPITAGAVDHYLREMAALFGFGPEDVFAQAVEFTFDLSVHDMMLAWSHGARLVVAPEGAAALVPRLVREHGITRWLSVPSAAAQAKTLGQIGPGSLPSLRTMFFCGEALPLSLAQSLAAAAPGAEIVNIYGPTEATIAFTVQRGADRAAADPVALGHPLGAQQVRLSETGEIWLSGPQLSPGYLADPEKTADRFVLLDGARWYRTGDRGRPDPAGGWLFAGRMDSQIKLRGYRVELGEVERALRQAAGTDLVAALALAEVAPSSYEGLAAVTCGGDADEAMLRQRLAGLLPRYMIPDRYLRLAEMPKNANDKVDYLALRRMLEPGA